MRILFILPEYYPHSGGGISTYYLHYLKALRPFCEKIKVIVGSGYTCSDQTYHVDGIEIEYLTPQFFSDASRQFDKFSLWPDLKNNLAAAWAMYEQAKHGEGFDLVECTDFALGYIPWVMLHNRPVITRLHGSAGQIHLHETNKNDELSTDFYMQTELLTLPCSDRLITYSGANQKFWAGTIGHPVVKIDPVFETDNAVPLPRRARDPYGLVTARVQEWKGPVQLCEALSKMAECDLPPIHWFGRDMLYKNRQSTTEFLRETYPAVWDHKILPFTPLPNAAITELQRKALFGIVPSTWDMFNFTCLEFMAFGTPLICSDGAGASDLIEHGLNGLKYSANDARGFAACLREITRLGNEDYDRLARSGVATVKEKLSGEKLIPLNLQQYHAVLDNFKPRGVNDFIKHIYMPSGKAAGITETLDKLPLKTIMNYTLTRALSKLKN